MMLAIMNPCIVIVLEIMFKHAPCPRYLDLHFMLYRLCTNIGSRTKRCFSAAEVAANGYNVYPHSIVKSKNKKLLFSRENRI